MVFSVGYTFELLGGGREEITDAQAPTSGILI